MSYDLHLYDVSLGDDFGYRGEVNILVDVLIKTKTIVLNATQLLVESAEWRLQDKKVQASSIKYEEELQRVIFLFDEEIAPNLGSLAIKFKGTINDVCLYTLGRRRSH